MVVANYSGRLLFATLVFTVLYWYNFHYYSKVTVTVTSGTGRTAVPKLVDADKGFGNFERPSPTTYTVSLEQLGITSPKSKTTSGASEDPAFDGGAGAADAEGMSVAPTTTITNTEPTEPTTYTDSQVLESTSTSVPTQTPGPTPPIKNTTTTAGQPATLNDTESTTLDPDPASLSRYDQKDPFLTKLVREYHIIEPSTGFGTPTGPTGLVYGIWPALNKITNGTPGFFVEAGAFDGVMASNTIWLEQAYGWTGLLVECHPEVLKVLKGNKRKSYISDACLSNSTHPTMAELTSVDGWHPSSSLGKEKELFPAFAKTFTTFKVQTIPLYTLLAAINVTTVDFVSLDIQGLELPVLQNFPFDSILVKTWLIEIELMSKEDKDTLKNLMRKNGYGGPMAIGSADHFYVHRSVIPKNSTQTV